MLQRAKLKKKCREETAGFRQDELLSLFDVARSTGQLLFEQ